MEPTKLYVNRSGGFEVTDTNDHPTQCGKVGHRSYKYFIRIEASNKSLTKEGFVIDNAICDNYFKETYQGEMKCDSCENMALRAIEYFRRIFAHNYDLKEVELLGVYVRIHGSDFSFIEAEWPMKKA